ncbi:MAG: GDP-mannose 4,6-dehydratase, partial [Gemmatimonadota bacterium]|nr:GDP-mannose 4,6-dehydratase [Gemmatimonadota bacterium]
MKVAVITGSAGLIGSEAVAFFCDKFDLVVGIDNNYRQVLFGEDASTEWSKKRLEESVPNYKHSAIDIRDFGALQKVFAQYNQAIMLVVNTAAQPSHDWAVKEPLTDFTFNANGPMN